MYECLEFRHADHASFPILPIAFCYVHSIAGYLLMFLNFILHIWGGRAGGVFTA